MYLQYSSITGKCKCKTASSSPLIKEFESRVI